MKLIVIRAGIVAVGDRLGMLNTDGQMVFRRVTGNYQLPDMLGRDDCYKPSPDIEIAVEDGPRVEYRKKDRVLVGVRF